MNVVKYVSKQIIPNTYLKNHSLVQRELLQLVYSDLCGPLKEESIRISIYILTFIDDYTRKSFIFVLESNSQVFEKLMNLTNYAEKQQKVSLLKLRTDNGGE